MHDPSVPVPTCDSYLIALGANMPSQAGPPRAALHSALDALGAAGARAQSVSSFYHTPCFPPGAGPDYVNAAARIAFEGTPQDLLALLHEVEARFGRTRAERWGQRVLDLDLIAAGNHILPDPQTVQAWLDLPLEAQKTRAPEALILPHPRLQDRAFVLVPLADVAPDWRHPVLGQTVLEMCAGLPASARAEVRLLD